MITNTNDLSFKRKMASRVPIAKAANKWRATMTMSRPDSRLSEWAKEKIVAE